jgi:putative PIN family toxin of toxin-antitoxin system
MSRAGMAPDLLDEVSWWDTNDLWVWSLYALIVFVRIAFELVIPPLLIQELERALAYPELRRRISEEEAQELVALLHDEADLRPDPADAPSVRSSDWGDDYLIALAAAAQAVLVSGDNHLLALSDELPVRSPASFLTEIEQV